VLAILSPASLLHLPLLKRELGQIFEKVDIIAPRNIQHLHQVIGSSARLHKILLAVGGDGTLHQVLRTMDPELQILGIIPSGTGNDFARSLNLPKGIKQCCRNLAKLEPRSVDLCKANGIRFINSGGFGLDSATLKLRKDRPGYFTKNYNLAFLQALIGMQRIPAVIETDEGEFQGKFFWVLAMNTPYIGGGTKIAPDAAIDDGLLRVLMVKDTSKFRLAANLPRALKGQHTGVDCLVYRQLRSFTVNCENKLDYLALDGEMVFLGERTVTFKVIEGGLRFLR
jgi:YegS/Rv2252/BmrU family lipid kinase